MAKKFTTPARGPGAPNPKIATAVPLANAGPEKQAMYGELADVVTASNDKLDIDVPVETPKADVEEAERRPDETDRKAFLSALLGGKPYVKKFTIFGTMHATFQDRTVEETEIIYSILNKAYKEESIDDNEYDTLYERYLLAAQLDALDNKHYDRALRPDIVDPTAELTGRVDELMKLSRPVYHGLMEVCRRFESDNKYMTEHALDSDFWKPGGQA